MSAIPEVLAGPIVRHVAQRLCSLWIALSHPASVQASIWRGIQTAGGEPGTVATGDVKIAEGTATTLPAARRLAVAIVTVKLDPTEPSHEPGQIYAYESRSSPTPPAKGSSSGACWGPRRRRSRPNCRPGGRWGCRSATLRAACHRSSRRPPWRKNVRMAHCSCRESNPTGRDALAFLDDIVWTPVGPKRSTFGPVVGHQQLSKSQIGAPW